MALKTLLAALTAILSLSTATVSADDIRKGGRGPTNYQLDERITYSDSDKSDGITDNLIFKYWDGTDSGKFFFISLPYKLKWTSEDFNHGFGDVLVGAGPRGTIKDFHWIAYAGLKLPTGNAPLGDGRHDLKFGAFGTYLFPIGEVDVSLEYLATGENKANQTPPNEISAGALVGINVTDALILASGVSAQAKTNEDYLLNSHSVARYTFSPELHLELLFDTPIDSEKIPESWNYGLFVRYNF